MKESESEVLKIEESESELLYTDSTTLVGTMKAVQHNFQFIQGVLLSITLYTTCFGTILLSSSQVSAERFCTGRYCVI
jgi:hypothetical protein